MLQGCGLKACLAIFFFTPADHGETCYTSCLVVYLVNSSYKTLFCNNSRNYPKITLAVSQTEVKKDAEIKA